MSSQNIVINETQSKEYPLFDNIKILELSNFIDEWEKTVLFSENGFYSLKGKELEGKTEKLIEMLENDSLKILSEFHFDFSLSSKKAERVKNVKILTIKNKMLEYEEQEKLNYEKEISDSAIEQAKEKAKNYKNSPEIIEKCYLNALSAIGIKARLFNFSGEEINNYITNFNSEFFEKIINGFISDNSLEAENFYLRNKNYILKEKRKEIEENILQLKNRIDVYELAKKCIYTNQSREKAIDEVLKIKDDKKRKYTKLYIEGIYDSKEKEERYQKSKKNEEIWNDIDKSLAENSDFALFNIDLNSEENVINAQLDYIKSMIKFGKTETNNKKYFELYKCAFENPNKFERTDLNNFKAYLNKEDFEYFKSLTEKISDLKTQYYEMKHYFKDDVDYNVLLIKVFEREKNIYEKNNNKQLSLTQTAELINAAAAQIKKWDLLRKRG